jgi:hypothetical protein
MSVFLQDPNLLWYPLFMETFPEFVRHLSVMSPEEFGVFAKDNGFDPALTASQVVLVLACAADLPDVVTHLAGRHPGLASASLPDGPFGLFIPEDLHAGIRAVGPAPSPLVFAIGCRSWRTVQALLDLDGLDLDGISSGDKGLRLGETLSGPMGIPALFAAPPRSPLGALALDGLPEPGDDRWRVVARLLEKGANPLAPPHATQGLVYRVNQVLGQAQPTAFGAFWETLMGRATPARHASVIPFFSLFGGLFPDRVTPADKAIYTDTVGALFEELQTMERGYRAMRQMGDTRAEDAMKKRLLQLTGLDLESCVDSLLVWFVQSGFDPVLVTSFLEKSPVARALLEKEHLGALTEPGTPVTARLRL